MKLVSMKKTPKEEPKAETECAPCGTYSEPEYPWGLQINLEEESFAKLGIDLPKAGAVMTLTAKVSVSGVGSQETEEGLRRNLSLQITEMALDAPKDTNKLVKEMYGE